MLHIYPDKVFNWYWDPIIQDLVQVKLIKVGIKRISKRIHELSVGENSGKRKWPWLKIKTASGFWANGFKANVKGFYGTIAWWQPCSGAGRAQGQCYLPWYQAGGQQRPYQSVGLLWIKLGMPTLNHPGISLEVKPLNHPLEAQPIGWIFCTGQVATGPFGMKHGMPIVWGDLGLQSTRLTPLTSQLLQPKHVQGIWYGLSAGLSFLF